MQRRSRYSVGVSFSVDFGWDAGDPASERATLGIATNSPTASRSAGMAGILYPNGFVANQATTWRIVLQASTVSCRLIRDDPCMTLFRREFTFSNRLPRSGRASERLDQSHSFAKLSV